MTPGDVITTALYRAGIPNPTEDQKTRARFYLNTVKADIEGMDRWRFLYKVGTLTTVADQRTYDLASGVVYPLNFWDSSNDNPMVIIHPEDIDRLDPDQDMTGEAHFVSIIGVDDTTGVWEVDLYPTPTDAGDTIKYRYYKTIGDYGSSDDDTDMGAIYPRYIQNAFLWGTCALYKEEKEQNASGEWEKYAVSVQQAIKTNGRNDVSPRIILSRSENLRQFAFTADIPVD